MDSLLLIGSLLIAAGVAFTMRQKPTAAPPPQTAPARGIRNHNPGNLVLTDIAWQGKVPNDQNTDGVFEQFVAPEWGLRAMFMDIRGDIERDGLDTIAQLISVYAPRVENDTDSYIASVSQQLGKGPDVPLMPDDYFPLMKAIIRHENGQVPYSDAQIQAAMALA